MSDNDPGSSSESTPNLFPNIFNVDQLQNQAASPLADEEDGSDSIFQIRNALFKPPNDQETRKSLVKLEDTFRTLFDTGSVKESEDQDDYSIHSSVIKSMQLQDDLAAAKQEGSKFAFLDGYVSAFKTSRRKGSISKTMTNPETVNGIPLLNMDADDNHNFQENDNDSVFDISNVNDFEKYLKQTELNQKIQKKYETAFISDDNNLLDVVPTVDMGEYVGNFDDDNNDKTLKTNTPWYAMEWKKALPKSHPNRINEINTLSLSSSSNQSNYNDLGRRTLQRRLKVRHLQMISFGGTLGVGLYLNAGKALSIAGGFGALLAFFIVGLIVLATIVSFSEMVTFVSVVDGVSGLSSRFVDDSFGFASGWLYFVSFAFGLAGEIVASVIMLSYFTNLKITENKGSRAGFVTLFLVSILTSNLIDVQIFGEIEYISSLIKLLWTLGMIITLIIQNTGYFGTDKIGFKYWDHSRSDFDHNIIFGLFRPTFDLRDNGQNGATQGIGGNKGRLMSLLVAIMSTSYAYSGTEIVCIAACEAQNPRKALPSATRRVFWRILIFYCLSIFIVSLNVYAGDPRLLRYFLSQSNESSINLATSYAVSYAGGNNCAGVGRSTYAGYGSGSQSPWIVAFQSANLCSFSAIVDGFLVFFGVSCGNAQLYVSSRTVYSLALQKKAPKFLTYCSKRGIPYFLVLFAGSFGLLAYLCVNEKATSVFQNLTSLISSSGISVWFAMCLSFIRFYYGLKKRPDIIGRDDKSYPYRSRFQPYTAIFGLIGSSVILLFMGYVVFLNGHWDTLFFFSSYGTLMIFAVLYFGHKWIMGTRIPSLETLDFDTGRREIDRYIWDGGREYNVKNIKEVTHKWLSFLA